MRLSEPLVFSRARPWLVLPAVLLMMAPTCGLFENPAGIEFPPVGWLVINYNDDTTTVDAITLLAEDGGPLNGYMWSLASGSSYPPARPWTR